MNASECEHDYDNPVRKGRAQYVCPKCGEDITLLLVMMMEIEENETLTEK